jgi:hypothetical protein
MITGAEIPVIAAILGGISKSVADVGVKGSEALIAYMRKEGPIAHRVLASWRESKDYCVAVEFLNVTVHGGYVEKIESTKPSKDLDFRVASARRIVESPGISFGREEKVAAEVGGAKHPIRWQKQLALLPLYVASAGTAEILLRFKDDAARTLARTRMVTLSYEFSIVGGGHSQAKPKEVEIRLREHGPYYLDNVDEE